MDDNNRDFWHRTRIDEQRRTLLRLSAIGALTFGGVNTADTVRADSGVQVTKEDLTGDGDDDIRLKNDSIYVQTNSTDLSSRNILSAIGHQGGTSVSEGVETRPTRRHDSHQHRPSFDQLKAFEVVKNEDTVGSYRILRDYTFPNHAGVFEVDAIVTLFSGDRFVLVELTYTNAGDAAITLDQEPGNIHDGIQIFQGLSLVGRSDSDPGYRFHLAGHGTHTFQDTAKWQTFSGTERATFFDEQDAMTYGLLKGTTSPKMWIEEPGTLDYLTQETTLDSGESLSYTSVFGVHDGGSDAPSVGKQIYDTAQNRDATPTQPLEELRTRKLELADRIDTISVSALGEKELVQTTLTGLTNAVDSGSVEPEVAEEAVQRMLLAEETTQLTLQATTQSDPPNPEFDGTDYQIARRTGLVTVETIIELLTTSLGFTSIADEVDFGWGIIDDAIDAAESKIDEGISFLAKHMLGSFDTLSNVIDNNSHEIADEIGDFIESKTDAKVDEIIEKIKDRVKQVVADSITPLIRKQMEVGEFFDTPTNIDDALTDLNEQLDADSVQNGLEGTLTGAEDAKQEGVAQAESTLQIADDAIDTFSQEADEKGLVKAARDLIVAAQSGDILGTLWNLVILAKETVFDFVEVILDAFSTGVGWGAIANLEENHYTTVQGVIQGNPTG